MSMENPFIWYEVSSPDAGATADFYSKAFGWTVTSMNFPEYGDYHMFTVPGAKQAFAGISRAMDGAPPQWQNYIYVVDVDKKVAEITELGGTIIAPPFDLPTIGRMAFLADPMGATFWVFTPDMPASEATDAAQFES